MLNSIYIYGAGSYGKACYKYLKSLRITINGFIVSVRENNPKMLFDVPVFTINDLGKLNKFDKIIVALKKSYRKEVIDILENKGIKQYYFYPEVLDKGAPDILPNYKELYLLDELKRYIRKLDIYNFHINNYKKTNPNREEQIARIGKYKSIIDLFEKALCVIGQEQVLLEGLAAGKELVILFSHEFDLTGAPIALLEFAHTLKKMGKCPLVVTLKAGVLGAECQKKSIPFVVVPNDLMDDFIEKTYSCYGLVVVNTIVNAPIISKLNGKNISVIWWIHEAEISYTPEILLEMPDYVADNIRICCVGRRAETTLLKYRPNYKNISHLYYTIPDNRRSNLIGSNGGKTIFASVGMISTRKAQDVLCEAITLLPFEYIEKSLFYIVGYPGNIFINNQLLTLERMFPNNVKVFGELSPKDVSKIYDEMDCLICSSKDDPMPIVVTEAFSRSKLVICSENAGSANLIREMNSGIVYDNNSPKQLMQCIKRVLDNKSENFTEERKNARKTYEKYFTDKVFKNNIRMLLSDSLQNKPADGIVSVIIPTFNGGDDVKNLLANLKLQTGLSGIEIIVVDSESTDGTDSYAENHGAKVIRIKQKDFSHSYARNLGVENTKGKYILFMTQDALPYDNQFIIKLLQPLLHNKAVAASCQQIPRSTCDLFGRIQSYEYSIFMDALKRDRILSMPENQDYSSLRINAQLDDVSCIIKKDIFILYKYRRNYAEDLDLGLRLISDGHKLAFLSSVKVVHSHTRSAFYYLKRSLVNEINLNDILPQERKKISKAAVINQIITAYFFMDYLFKNTDILFECCSGKDFKEKYEEIILNANAKIKKYNTRALKSMIEQPVAPIGADLQKMLKCLLRHNSQKNIKFDLILSQNQTNFVNIILDFYLKKLGMTFTKENYSERIDNILDSYVKYFGQTIGFLFADYLMGAHGADTAFDKFLKGYMVGV